MITSSPHMKKLVPLFLIAALMLPATAMAQLTDIGSFLRAGKEDATLLTREYLKPFPTGFGTGLNAGWSETAAPKKTLGFSLQVRPSVALVPSSDQEFDISALTLSRMRLASGENPITPTIAGSDSGGPEMVIEDENGNELSRFNMPGGTGVNFVPAPVVQAGLGLVKGTDITLRYLPETEVGDYGNFSLLGGAVKHELTQWLPGNKLIPVDISVMVGFNQIDITGNLDVRPDLGSTPADPTDPGDFSDQVVETTTNTMVINAMVGKNLPFISVYAGAGYQKATFDLAIKGDYPVELPFNQYEVIRNPVNFSIDSETSAHLLGGFRIKLGVLAIYGEATLANYFTANAGVGISFR